jgi:hypothetical protein
VGISHTYIESVVALSADFFFSVCGDEGGSGIQKTFSGPEAILLY